MFRSIGQNSLNKRSPILSILFWLTLIILFVATFIVLLPFTTRLIIKLYTTLGVDKLPKTTGALPYSIFESSTLLISIFTLMVTTVLAGLTYRISKLQFSMLDAINNDKPQLIIHPFKCNIISHFEDRSVDILNGHFYGCGIDDLKFNMNKLLNFNCEYPVSFQIELLLSNECKSHLPLIITDVSIEIYDGDTLVSTRKSVKREVQKNLVSSGTDLVDEKDFTPIFIQSNNYVQKILSFKAYDKGLFVEEKKYNLSIHFKTSEGEIVSCSEFVFKGIANTFEKESRKLMNSVKLLENFSVKDQNDKGGYNKYSQLDLLLKGLGCCNKFIKEEDKFKYKFSNTETVFLEKKN
jgi:hypothetical protein